MLVENIDNNMNLPDADDNETCQANFESSLPDCHNESGERVVSTSNTEVIPRRVLNPVHNFDGHFAHCIEGSNCEFLELFRICVGTWRRI